MTFLAIAAGCSARIGVMEVVRDRFIIYSAHNNIALYDDLSKETKLLPASDVVGTLTANENFVFAGCKNGEFELYNISDDKPHIKHAYSSKAKDAVVYSCCLDDLAFFSCIDGTVYSLDHRELTLKQLVSIPAPKRITALGALKFGALNNILIIANSDSSLSLYLVEKDTDRLTELVTLTDHHTKWIYWISSHDGRFLTCGQDNNVRIWSVKPFTKSDNSLQELVTANRTFKIGETCYTVDTEAILMGHESSVVSGSFIDKCTVITSSYDRTVMKWIEEDDVWKSILQMGDVAGIGVAGSGDLFDVRCLKGSPIAHNTNGTIASFGTCPQVLVSGHSDEVSDLCFDPSSSYLLSCSLDRTCRSWTFDESGALREIARPQIHGYELRSLAFLSDSVYVSAGDEKVLRMFQATSAFANRLERLTGRHLDSVAPTNVVLQPALGLSNKAVEGKDDVSDIPLFPSENELSSSTLFPEIDKLYGHGDELQCVACSPDGLYIASASRAALAGDSSVRIWDAATHRTLHVIRPHNLTVVRLAFSPNSKLLLSVSRDRNFAIVNVQDGTVLMQGEAHDRIIWDGAWINDDLFVTGSRDKTVKIWSISDKTKRISLPFDQPVTAVCICQELLLVGVESGEVYSISINYPQDSRALLYKANGRINRIAYDGVSKIALASSDRSIVVLKIH